MATKKSNNLASPITSKEEISYGKEFVFKTRGKGSAEAILDFILSFSPNSIMIVNNNEAKPIRISQTSGLFLRRKRGGDLRISTLHRQTRQMRGSSVKLRMEADNNISYFEENGFPLLEISESQEMTTNNGVPLTVADVKERMIENIY